MQGAVKSFPNNQQGIGYDLILRYTNNGQRMGSILKCISLSIVPKSNWIPNFIFKQFHCISLKISSMKAIISYEVSYELLRRKTTVA